MTIIIGLIFTISPLILLFGMLALVVGLRDACAIALTSTALAFSVWFGIRLLMGAL